MCKVHLEDASVISEKKTLCFPVSPFSIDPSELNMVVLKGVSQPDFEIELDDKDIWISKFRSLTANLENLARQKADLAQSHNWSEIENLPKPDQLSFETWNALLNVYKNMKKYALAFMSIFGSTYVCEQLFSNMNYIKNRYRTRLTDGNLQSCMKMKVASYNSDVQMLSAEMQEQKSH